MTGPELAVRTTHQDQLFPRELLCETVVSVVVLLGTAAAFAGGFTALDRWLHPGDGCPAMFPPGTVITIPAR